MATNDQNLDSTQPVENIDTQMPIERNIDWFLESLVSRTNNNRGCLGITLHCSGLIVTGYLISGSEFFELLAESCSSEEHPAESIFEQEKEIYANLDDRRANFIHLKQAQLMYPNGNPIPKNGCLWRGQLDHVSGFHLGVLEMNTD
ncbi:hypothetical protein DX883_06490 [Vibrio fluvialis]|nr:hypothetical protein [Vibrio fluvialis]